MFFDNAPTDPHCIVCCFRAVVLLLLASSVFLVFSCRALACFLFFSVETQLAGLWGPQHDSQVKNICVGLWLWRGAAAPREDPRSRPQKEGNPPEESKN